LRLVDRLDDWAGTSRLNLWRLLVMRKPRLAEADRAAFDALLARTPPGGVVDYDLAQPRWWFLHHVVERGFVLHGSNEPEIEEFRTRQTFDAYDRPIDAVFASDDAIWPLYFAVANRERLDAGYINWCLHTRGEARYLFSLGADPRAEETWTSGTIYVLPRDTFRPTPGSRELVSDVAVRPRARLRVEPDDFPFRAQTVGHRKGDTPRRVALRHALRSPRPRSRAPGRSPRRGA
jgi:hypothetical protein